MDGVLQIFEIRDRLCREYFNFSAPDNRWEGCGTTCDPFVRIDFDPSDKDQAWTIFLHTRYGWGYEPSESKNRPDKENTHGWKELKEPRELGGIECAVTAPTELEAWKRFERMVRICYWSDAVRKKLGYNLYKTIIRARKKCKKAIWATYYARWDDDTTDEKDDGKERERKLEALEERILKWAEEVIVRYTVTGPHIVEVIE